MAYISYEEIGIDPMFEYLRIPQHTVGSLYMYLILGVRTGDFLNAVLKNDLHEACSRADQQNKRLLHVYSQFLHNFAPSNSYGSQEIIDKYCEERSKQPLTIGALDGFPNERFELTAKEVFKMAEQKVEKNENA